MAELGSTQYERVEPRLTPPVTCRSYGSIPPACERPYTKMEVLTISLAEAGCADTLAMSKTTYRGGSLLYLANCNGMHSMKVCSALVGS
jgi:hypothetical protein